ncbi:hypothetical protein Cs7R123_25530 [Catellatospora sp. TT07R-123]|uniref:DUF6745 domain-containing protein n=1 Tax=Catellatospora sp. TT07R-123 TaxID=2733863 RepID=UPI001B0308B9|nr:hypothetical protein [Catellatospora sp. TT07R-123]GHJ45211.1 hypothetical protein Cs7R123_25530 [Catellatospora sp. TT07R-123]
MLLEDMDLAQRAEAWLGSGLCTEPAERAAAEAGVRQAYAAAGLPAPARIVWLGSPEAGAVAVALLTTGAAGTLPAGAELVRTRLLTQGCAPGTQQLGRSVRPQVRTAPWARARAALSARLGGVGFARHWAASARRPWQQLNEQLATPLRTRLDAQFAADTGPLGQAARAALLDVVHGQHDAAWLPAFTGAAVDGELSGLAAVAASAGWWWAYEQVAILTERPTALHRDNLGRLHHGSGPALSYPDGFALYAWRGMPIPPDVAAELPRLTIERIRAEDNAEVRRVMLEFFGYDRYLRESKARELHRDETGILWRVELPGDEPLVMVEVVNSTAEPDGSFRTYFLRVPPTTRTARGGVAWTFGVTEEEYQPLVQT